MTAPLVFQITGMDCAEEVAVLKREVGPVVGGERNLGFDIINGRMTVESLPSGADEKAVIAAVERAGLQAQVATEDSEGAEPDRSLWQRRRRVTLTSVSGLSILAALAADTIVSGGATEAGGGDHALPLLAKLLFGVAIISGVWLVLPKAASAVRRLRPDMNLLMTVAVIGAVAIGEWFEAATVSFLFALSLLLESWSVNCCAACRGRLDGLIAADGPPPSARWVIRRGSSRPDSCRC